MKGVILCGGEGTRLKPCTNVTNKQLLPIYDRPMIMYPIKTLIDAGITDILLILGRNNCGDLMKLIKNGEELGATSILYAYQEKSNGIADAMKLAKQFINNGKFCMILGDNILFDNLSYHVNIYKSMSCGKSVVFLTEHDHPESFGVADMSNNIIIKITEKPTHPTSNLIVTGVYFFDNHVFDPLLVLRGLVLY